MEVVVKSLIGIFTVIDGDIKLLMDNNNLIEINCINDIENDNQIFIDTNLNINNLDLKQCYTFSDKVNNRLEISILFTDIVNYNDIKSNNYSLKSINDLENNKYINKLLDCLKKDLVLNSTIKKLYPEEFILPEIQKIYEDLLNKKYDRRNFRKKLIKLDVIEDLNIIKENKKGRPAKLYKFKDIIEDKILF